MVYSLQRSKDGNKKKYELASVDPTRMRFMKKSISKKLHRVQVVKKEQEEDDIQESRNEDDNSDDDPVKREEKKAAIASKIEELEKKLDEQNDQKHKLFMLLKHVLAEDEKRKQAELAEKKIQEQKRAEEEQRMISTLQSPKSVDQLLIKPSPLDTPPLHSRPIASPSTPPSISSPINRPHMPHLSSPAPNIRPHFEALIKEPPRSVYYNQPNIGRPYITVPVKPESPLGVGDQIPQLYPGMKLPVLQPHLALAMQQQMLYNMQHNPYYLGRPGLLTPPMPHGRGRGRSNWGPPVVRPPNT